MRIAITGIRNTSPTLLHIVLYVRLKCERPRSSVAPFLNLYSTWIFTFIQLRIPFCYWCAPGCGTGFTPMSDPDPASQNDADQGGSGSATLLMPTISYVLSVLYSAMYGMLSNLHLHSTYKIHSLLWFILVMQLANGKASHVVNNIGPPVVCVV